MAGSTGPVGSEPKLLPVLLSPTLPAVFDDVSPSDSSDGGNPFPLEPISPTLPQSYDHSLIVSFNYKPMPRIKKGSSNTRSYSSSEDEKPPLDGNKKDKVDDEKSTEKRSEEVKEKTAGPKTTEMPPQYRKHKTCLQQWVKQARSKKHESDSAISSRQHRLAAVVSIDSIICFIRAFDHEDRAEKIAGRHPHIRSWETLIPYLSQMVTYLESVDSDIAGVCYLIRAVIQVYIAQNMHKTRLKATASGTALSVLYQRAVSDFGKGLLYLPLETVKSKYRLDWSETVRNKEGVDPEADRCVLPLHVNSTVQDAAAFALSVSREWAKHESIDYEWVGIVSTDKIPDSL